MSAQVIDGGKKRMRRTLTLFVCGALATLGLVACSSGSSLSGTSGISGGTPAESAGGSSTSGTQSQSGTTATRITCTARPAGTDVSSDLSVVSDRAKKLNPAATVAMVGNDQITIDLPSNSGDATGLCTSTRLDFRGLIAPAATISGSTATKLDLESTAIPTIEDQYQALSASAKSQLATELGSFNCADGDTESNTASSDFVACDATGELAYLLGPIVVPGTEIDSATAVAPNVSQGTTQWTVALSLKSSGASAWANYTAAHNIGGGGSSTADPTNCGPSTAVPCADFVGFVLDGAVISLPVNISAINGGTTQISGNFTESSAKKLASNLQAGALPINLTLSSEQTVTH